MAQNKISIGIMTQASKIAHLKMLFTCLLKQENLTKGKYEIIIFSDTPIAFDMLDQLEVHYAVHCFTYAQPFNIGSVRNSVIRNASNSFVTFLDDDVVISKSYLKKLESLLVDAPAIVAGLSYQVFKYPEEMLTLFLQYDWDDLVKKFGKRDYYTRKIGRYEKVNLYFPELGKCNWLGCIGRNLTVKRDIAINNPFFESKRLGFQDLEFAYRLERKGLCIKLTNDIELACLHLFHSHRPGKFDDYRIIFEQLVASGELPQNAAKFFFNEGSVTA